MAWTGFPLDNEDTQDFEWIIQFWEAVRERHRAVGTLRWPRTSEAWETGTVTSVVANGDDDDTYTLTSSGKEWCLGGDNPWACSEAEIPWAPGTWRVFIEWDTDNYRQFIVADVTEWTADTLKIGTITDYLTSKELDSLGTLAGKTFVITRGDHGIWWQERWPENPQATEHTKGNIVAVGAADGNTNVTDDTKDWKVDQWVGYEFIVIADDGFMKRVVIAANTHDTLE